MKDWYGSVDEVVLDNILESMSDSLIVVGHRGDVLYANRATAEILGYGLTELKEKGLAQVFFLRDENYDFNQLFVDAVWNKSINQYSEVDYHHPDGSVRRLAATTSYLIAGEEDQSAFAGIVALFKDITETFNLIRKEKQLIKEKERIAGQKIESLRKLAMGVAHEIRNPVVTIGGFSARMLRDENNPEHTRRSAANILEDAGRLERLVEEVQRYCNLPRVSLVPGQLGAPIEAAVEYVRPKAAKKEIDIVLSQLNAGSRQLVFDPALVKEALIHLLDNAIDFSPEGSRVEVSLRYDDQGATIDVKDSGAGIGEADLPFVFDPFFSTRAQGSGMGLSIVERIVQEHMGRIEAQSSPGQGTTVSMFIPHLD